MIVAYTRCVKMISIGDWGNFDFLKNNENIKCLIITMIVLSMDRGMC